jgi:hypothetical protein
MAADPRIPELASPVMDIDGIAAHILATFPGTHPMRAGEDHFFIHDPHRDLPDNRMIPWATLTTSDAHDDASDLDRSGVFRLNIGLTRAAAAGLGLSAQADRTALDVFLPHPVYGGQHWVCVLNPDRTWPQARELLVVAHDLAVRKWTRWAERRG